MSLTEQRRRELENPNLTEKEVRRILVGLLDDLNRLEEENDHLRSRGEEAALGWAAARAAMRSALQDCEDVASAIATLHEDFAEPRLYQARQTLRTALSAPLFSQVQRIRAMEKVVEAVRPVLNAWVMGTPDNARYRALEQALSALDAIDRGENG